MHKTSADYPSLQRERQRLLQELSDLQELRRGGQGVVYRATQRSTRRSVAIKVLLDGAYASPQARLRFERDYISAVLQHHGWRMADAAETLGIQRPNLYRKARQLGIPLTRASE